MNSPLTVTCALACAASLVGQDPLRIAELQQGGSVSWAQNLQEPRFATVQYDEEAGEYTLLFVHTTIDETVAGPIVTAGILNALPFLASPTNENWQLTDPAFTALSEYEFSGEQPMVPPSRLAAHIDAFIAGGYSQGYGTANSSGTGYVTHETAPGQVNGVIGSSDERRAWMNSSWEWFETAGMHGFDTVTVGRESIFQAAYLMAESEPNLPPLNEDAIHALGDLMDSKLGFEIYIQAAHVLPANNSDPVRVRLNRHARVRRRSLHENTLGWVGPDRYVPHPYRANTNVWLAPHGDEMHIIFPYPVGSTANPTTLRAHVPTSNGVVTVDQIANPTWAGELVRPEVAIFPVPANATAGLVHFEKIISPGVPLIPVNHINRGAYIWPYTPPPATPPGTGGGTAGTTGSGNNPPGPQ